MRRSRGAGFGFIAGVYILGAALGLGVFTSLPGMTVSWRVLAGDVAATGLVWLAGLIVRNASVYDPYWSVAPIVIVTGLVVRAGRVDAAGGLLLAAIWFWGVRLTANWAVTFRDLGTQDWRYDDFRARFPRLFPVISLTGISLFPTLVVYLCLLPAIAVVDSPGRLNAGVVAGFVVCLGAAGLQLVADGQMQRFRVAHAGQHAIIRDGVWRHARHPNYLGEIAMWWGVYLMMLSLLPALWWLAVGALVNTAMFAFISIPMADRRNRRLRPGFDDYCRQTRALLPVPRRVG